MNQFLCSAISRFDKMKGRDFLINPISQLDAEIMCEIIEVLRKAGINGVKEILKSYKNLKDEEIRDQLLQWHIDHPSLGVKRLVDKVADGMVKEMDAPESPPSPPIFKIGEIYISALDLIGFKCVDRYSEKKQDYEFILIINPMPVNHKLNKVPFFADEQIVFENETDRNIVLDKIKNLLSEKGIEIIDMSDE